MYHIVINEEGRYSKEFSMSKLPVVGKKLPLQLKDSDAPAAVFEITSVKRAPLGFSGRFNYEVKLKKLTRSRPHHPFTIVTECN